MREDLKDKVVIITGGTSGIGEGCVRYLASQGAKVVFCARSADKGIAIEKDLTKQGYSANYIRTDVTEPQANKHVVDETIKLYGRIDAILANAEGGVGHKVHEYAVDEWENDYKLNYHAAFLLSKYSIPYMLKNGGGSIIFMGSATMTKPGPEQGHYGPAKAAMVQLSRQISLDYCREGIRANVVSPSAVWSKLFDVKPEYLAAAKMTAPSRKVADPVDVAKVVAFLVSDDSKLVTGSNLLADYAYGSGIMYDQVVGMNKQ